MTSAPDNFSWIVPTKLAGMALPRLPIHYQYLSENGIRHLVTLCEQLPQYHDTCPAVKIHHIKIRDFCAPSFEQIKRFISIVEEANAKGEGVGVHCHHGFGRTGTMLACYLVKSRNITGADAIKEIRRIRNGSIETIEQEEIIVQFCYHIK
ncbi:dual specificity protein phosphatase 23b [Leucoraja erinacea]|uniref:dual specificity protein phosphatase 23b n=1 Tax=Leucoraja erinaceus TaxID=7782 RepID=UPI0024563D16|nr:dual specificity protein phosphatase 23b [Leucoraja erinacea]